MGWLVLKRKVRQSIFLDDQVSGERVEIIVKRISTREVDLVIHANPRFVITKSLDYLQKPKTDQQKQLDLFEENNV